MLEVKNFWSYRTTSPFSYCKWYKHQCSHCRVIGLLPVFGESIKMSSICWNCASDYICDLRDMRPLTEEEFLHITRLGDNLNYNY